MCKAGKYTSSSEKYEISSSVHRGNFIPWRSRWASPRDRWQAHNQQTRQRALPATLVTISSHQICLLAMNVPDSEHASFLRQVLKLSRPQCFVVMGPGAAGSLRKSAKERCQAMGRRAECTLIVPPQLPQPFQHPACVYSPDPPLRLPAASRALGTEHGRKPLKPLAIFRHVPERFQIPAHHAYGSWGMGKQTLPGELDH